jgi:hypothetical protein
MDLVAIIRSKIDRAGEGDHAPGLKAVLLHIETAVAHLDRGQDTADETAFTDCIYRTNQAFEGSLKEAFRVLTGKDPDKKTPHKIEEYFTSNDVFRSRVLAQFKNYRTEWRNPSTHDHKLDFDASEALLAIVSVCAFANVLLDQIIEKLAHDRSKQELEKERERIAKALKANEADLPSFAASLISEFISHYKPRQEGPRMREAEFLGSLSGFIESIAPKLNVQMEVLLGGDRHSRGDVLLSRGEEKLLVELKGMNYSRQLVRAGLEQLDRYFSVSGIDQGVLVIANPPYATPSTSDATTPGGRRVVIVAPKQTGT